MPGDFFIDFYKGSGAMFLYVTVTKKETYYGEGISTKKAARM